MRECPICHAKESRRLLRWDDYDINRCPGCGLIFSSPTPSEAILLAYYQGFLFRPPDDRDIGRTLKKKKVELQLLFGERNGERFIDGKRFLDYGGGTGISWYAAKQLGWDAYYQDLDLESVEFVKSRFGLSEAKRIERLNDSDVMFHVIFSDNVIEHVPDPVDFLRRLYDKLAEGGLLVVKTPHAGNTEIWFNPTLLLKEYFLPALRSNSFSVALKSLFKGFWHCAPPRHLFSFSKQSLLCVAKEVGVLDSNVEVSYYSAPLYNNTFTEYVYAGHATVRGARLALLRILAIPIVLVETTLQLVGLLLLKCGLVSPAGIIVKMKKARPVGSGRERT